MENLRNRIGNVMEYLWIRFGVDMEYFIREGKKRKSLFISLNRSL